MKTKIEYRKVISENDLAKQSVATQIREGILLGIILAMAISLCLMLTPIAQ